MIVRANIYHQGGNTIMAQGVLSFKYEEEGVERGMTALAGGDCVEDLRILEKDEGFCRLLQRVRLAGRSRKERCEMERRWRKERSRAVPSPSSVFRYLSAFHDPQEQKRREPGRAFIPAASAPLRGLMAVNRDFLVRLQAKKPKRSAPLDECSGGQSLSQSSRICCAGQYAALQRKTTTGSF